MKALYLSAASTLALGSAADGQVQAFQAPVKVPILETPAPTQIAHEFSSGELLVHKNKISAATRQIVETWAAQRRNDARPSTDPDYSEFWVEARPSGGLATNQSSPDDILLNWSRKRYNLDVTRPPSLPSYSPVADDSNWSETMYHDIRPDGWGEIGQGLSKRMIPEIRTNLTEDDAVKRVKPSEMFQSIKRMKSDRLGSLPGFDQKTALSELKNLKSNKVGK